MKYVKSISDGKFCFHIRQCNRTCKEIENMKPSCGTDMPHEGFLAVEQGHVSYLIFNIINDKII